MSKKHPLSVWDFGWSKWHYLTHPWKWFKDLKYSLRAAYMRTVYGWCYTDVWSWDDWFIHCAPNMLRCMADKGHAYPGFDEFDTPEKWHSWLHEMADLIETAGEDWQDKHNEYYEEYMAQFDKPNFKFSERSEIDKKYFERAVELAKLGQENVARAFVELGGSFHQLWD